MIIIAGLVLLSHAKQGRHEQASHSQQAGKPKGPQKQHAPLSWKTNAKIPPLMCNGRRSIIVVNVESWYEEKQAGERAVFNTSPPLGNLTEHFFLSLSRPTNIQHILPRLALNSLHSCRTCS